MFCLNISAYKILYIYSFHYTIASPFLSFFSSFSSQLYSKVRCDDQPILEHVEQLLGELGGEMEGEEGDPDVDEDYEPCSDEEEDNVEAPMEH